MTVTDLLAELNHAPRLPGARCRGQWQLFDATTHMCRGPAPREVIEARQAAVRICVTCPALSACRTWLASLPQRQRPAGVVAGLINGKSSPAETGAVDK